MSVLFRIMLIFVLLPLSGSPSLSEELAINPRETVVKVFVTANRKDYFRPWQSVGNSSSSGSGCIIDGNRILTNAHVVDSATFIQVRKESDPRKFTAKVEAIAHDADLAILSVNDPDFFKGTAPAKLGDLPFLQDNVIVIGFPEGGDKISITGGVVSRIELVPYSKSGKRLLAVQIDAAINPGNSGGPVFQDGKVIGVAMQVMNNSQNIGYIIPTPVIRHFLADMKDGTYDGFPLLGIDTRNTENKSLRDYYRLEDLGLDGGVLVTRVNQFSPADGFLKEGDVIIEVEDVSLAVDGTYPFRENERLFFSHLISSKFVGDEVAVTVVRDGKPLSLNIPLTSYTGLIPPPAHFSEPRYYIYGGLVFSVLSADLLRSWGPMWWEKAPVSYLNYIIGKGVLNEGSKREVVVLLNVLSDDINVGYLDFSHEIIERVNGKEFGSFEEFVKLTESHHGPYAIFETERNIPIILETMGIEEATQEILKRYVIPRRFSQDVEAWITIPKR